MDSTSLYDRFRSDVYDQQKPYLWSDAEVFQYMDAAYKQFVRLTGGIADSSSDLTQLVVTANDPWVSVDPRILRFRRAHLRSTGHRVHVANHEELDSFSDVWDYGQVRAPRIDDTVGTVRYMVTNMEQDRVRLINVPQLDDVIELSVYRLPLKSISGKDQKLAEIHEQHHEYLLLWMKKLAYSKQDAETRNDKLAANNEAAFFAYCAQAKREREAREHKTRVVAYGGL